MTIGTRSAAAATVMLALVATRSEAQPRLSPTNLPGTMSMEGPPAGFDADRASAELRQAYGIPPAPDRAATREHAAWARAMSRVKQRILPNLAASDVYHGPAARLRVTNTTGSSLNWSGAVVTNGATSWSALSFTDAGTLVSVPAVGQPFGTCSGGWLYSAMWTGIDGGGLTGGQDVLQAGVEADAYCAGGYTTQYYSAWYEWAPGYEVSVTNLPVAPGDELYVVVWATSPTQGYAYLGNLSTGQGVSLSISPPAGTRLVGNSAEWVTERPTVGSSLATLARYTSATFSNAWAVDNRGAGSYAGYANFGDSLVYLTMLDAAYNPVSSTTDLGGSAISTADEGSAN